MKFVEAKKDSDVALAGIKVEIDWKNAGAQVLHLRDQEGHVVQVKAGGYGSSIEVLVPAPPTLVERWRVSGRIPGIQENVLEYHDTEYEANKRVRGLGEVLRVEHHLEVAKVQVTEEEAEAHPAPKDDVLVATPF